jgi:hypothetical protein
VGAGASEAETADIGDDEKADTRDGNAELDPADDESEPVGVALPAGSSTVGPVDVAAADPSAARATTGANWSGTSEATRRSESTRRSTSRAARFSGPLMYDTPSPEATRLLARGAKGGRLRG